MTTLMLNREEAIASVSAAKIAVEAAGFQFEGRIPLAGKSFRARHPLSGQEISVGKSVISARGASDPSRLFWVRIEINNGSRGKLVIKPWRMEVKEFGYQPVADLGQWTSAKLAVAFDTTDRRMAPAKVWHRIFRTLERQTYPTPISWPIC